MGIDDQCELWLWHIPFAVFTDADQFVVSYNAPANGFEEEFRSFGFVDELVDIGAGGRFCLARIAAAKIGYTAAPDF